MPDAEPTTAARAHIYRTIRVYSVCSAGDFTIELSEIIANSGGSSSVVITLDNTELVGADGAGPGVRLRVAGSDEIKTMAKGFEALAEELRNIA